MENNWKFGGVQFQRKINKKLGVTLLLVVLRTHSQTSTVHLLFWQQCLYPLQLHSGHLEH